MEYKNILWEMELSRQAKERNIDVNAPGVVRLIKDWFDAHWKLRRAKIIVEDVQPEGCNLREQEEFFRQARATALTHSELTEEQLDELENHPVVKSCEQAALERWARQSSEIGKRYDKNEATETFDESYWSGNRKKDIMMLIEEGYIQEQDIRG